MTIIQSAIMSVLSLGVQNGGISPDVPFSVIAPDPLAVSQNLRAARRAEVFRFNARLAGAVSVVVINGAVEA